VEARHILAADIVLVVVLEVGIDLKVGTVLEVDIDLEVVEMEEALDRSLAEERRNLAEERQSLVGEHYSLALSVVNEGDSLDRTIEQEVAMEDMEDSRRECLNEVVLGRIRNSLPI